MDCPICTTSLVPSSHESIDIDMCPEQHGVWLDNDRLLAVVRARNEDRPAEEEQAAVAAQASTDLAKVDEQPRGCPTCGAQMTKLNYGYQSGVLIDVCPVGHGLWLDMGELTRIEAWVEGSEALVQSERAQWNARLDVIEHEHDRKLAKDEGALHWGPFGRLISAVSLARFQRDDHDRH